jgi:hypothetical protein
MALIEGNIGYFRHKGNKKMRKNAQKTIALCISLSCRNLHLARAAAKSDIG